MRIDTQNNKRGLIIVILVCLGVFAPAYAQFQFTVLGSRFIESTDISPTQFSSIITAPLIPGMFLSLISGLLVDRFGAKRVLLFSILVTAAGACIRIWAGSYFSMFIGMMLIGVHATFLNTNAAKIFGYWFEPKKVGMLMGVFIAFVNGAMALGMGTGALFADMKTAFIVSTAVIFVLALLWLFFAKDKKTSEGRLTQSAPMMECLKASLKSRNVWITGIAIMLVSTGAAVMSMFLPTALVKVRGFKETTAGAVAMAIMLGSAFSCFVTPLIDAKIKNTKLLMFVYGLLGAIGVSFAWRAPQGVLIFAALFMTGFVTTGLTPVLASIPIQLKEIGPIYAGTAGGVVGTIQLFGTVVIPTYILSPIVGADYRLLFYLFGIILVIFAFFSQLLPKIPHR
ncbi:MAG: MFS transporter [Clostridiales bacterium]|jgi:NNP family nitrate/nitrite transporter-like MFS transporter|nr:MFS transporter [Clostridiales bacterium]